MNTFRQCTYVCIYNKAATIKKCLTYFYKRAQDIAGNLSIPTKIGSIKIRAEKGASRHIVHISAYLLFVIVSVLVSYGHFFEGMLSLVFVYVCVRGLTIVKTTA